MLLQLFFFSVMDALKVILISVALCNALPMSVGRICDLLLTNRIWKMLWAALLFLI